FAEVGNMPLPAKVLRKGITDMVRISDGRMSGTAYGTVVLHVAPEAAVGGPLAFVQTGDMIELDVPKRRLHLEVSDEKLARRKGAWKIPEPPAREMHRSHDRAMRPGRSRCWLGLWLRPLAACGDQARTFFRRLCRSQRNLLVRR